MNTIAIFVAQYFYLLPILILGGYFLMHARAAQKRMAFFALSGGLLTYLLGLIGNYLYYDPRPFVIDHFIPLVTHAANNGFPSDHTLLASAFAMVGTYWNKWLGLSLWIIAALIGAARVYVGIHHSLDVIGSMIFAMIGVSVVCFLFNHFQFRHRPSGL